MEQTQFPLTLERVRSAYEKTGMTPSYGYWIKSNRESCCPATACAIAGSDDMADTTEVIAESIWKDEVVANYLGIPSDLVRWFANGFDGRALNPDTFITAAQEEAYLAGWAVRDHLFPVVV